MLFSFSSAKKSRVVPGQKKVLILGAGYVAGPTVDYLLRDKDIHCTVGKRTSYRVLMIVKCPYEKEMQPFQ